MKRFSLLLLIGAAITACQHTGNSHQAGSNAIDGSDTDTAAWVTFSGTLPCADCNGIVTELSLEMQPPNAIHHFRLKETYLGKNQAFPSEGIYKVLHGVPANPGATVIQLNPDRDKNLQRYFQRVGKNELKMLDRDQQQIKSNLNYTLKKVQ